MKTIFSLTAAAIIMTACTATPDYDATGIFEATTVTVSAETSGKILYLGINEGDSVTRGETIAVIDTATLVLQQKQLDSQRQSAESSSPDIAAQAAALRAQIAHQQHECERFSRLLADGATTQKQYDDAQAQLTTLRGQLTALLSTLGKNRSSISDNAVAIQYQSEQIEEQIAKSTVTSPLTGTVLVKYAEPGEFATPGRPLCKLADLDNIYLRSYFTASQLAGIKIGQKVTVIADFGGDEQYEYPGTVRWIAQESEFTPKSIQTKDSRANLVYAVKVAVRNDGRLKLGQYGEVRL
ncbi:MAG: HlyD family efflux transporter periplasmic adaptor subunit [Duncaniella sp.]|uniref:HlyD family secretion protein n=1 Tax=Duncaniella sp. TaxID=2518496 RepID=UPI0019A5D5C5|nr:HlyD family efflux transporter periplasmic adaptor subunit [Duncaniella sp.]MBD5312910.1 HlyD family efflux transporter periplasmic adaptor subunit [Bacteroides sp.]MDE6091256.1 HlyD family efflux transporter periplasmic adaptor subunit [Duncaniella sp.]